MKKNIVTTAIAVMALGYAGWLGWHGWQPAPARTPASVQTLGQYQYWQTIRPQTTCPGGRCPLVKPKDLPKPPQSADEQPSL